MKSARTQSLQVDLHNLLHTLCDRPYYARAPDDKHILSAPRLSVGPRLPWQLWSSLFKTAAAVLNCISCLYPIAFMDAKETLPSSVLIHDFAGMCFFPPFFAHFALAGHYSFRISTSHTCSNQMCSACITRKDVLLALELAPGKLLRIVYQLCSD